MNNFLASMLTGIFSLSLVTEAIYASPRIDDAQETRSPNPSLTSSSLTPLCFLFCIFLTN